MENQIVLKSFADFNVDDSQCLRCGTGVRDCAFKVLSLDKSGLPIILHPEKCMRCQHCFAICPVGAITFDGVKPSETVEIKNLELPNSTHIANWMRSRRSIRKFANEDVDPEVLDKVLKLLGNTPTGCNARALTFTCYPNRASMNEFRALFLKAIEEHRDGEKLLPRWLAVPAIKLRNGAEDMFSVVRLGFSLFLLTKQHLELQRLMKMSP